MNAKALAKHYGNLTPEERFRLILAASGRGDEAERDRLAKAGGRITLAMPDHAPYGHAFEEVGRLVFIELLEDAARYFDAFDRADDADDISGDEDAEEEDCDDERADQDDGEGVNEEAPAEGDRCTRPVWLRSLDIALAAGFQLRTKTDGWKLFCERMSVPPFLLWERLPGFDRLQRALALAEKAAFVPEGFLGWLNAVRPAGKPKLTEVPLTAEGMAAASKEFFRERVEWWSGEARSRGSGASAGR